MKSRFSSFDIAAALAEICDKGLGLRVNQVYDIDHKTYLLRFQKAGTKIVLLVESGIRIHLTEFEWPKNPAPSGFTMKLRKHVNNKRLEKVQQIGHDRIIDLQFGSDEAAYHMIIELYDKGNIALTDHEYTILNILRPRVEGENIRFFVRDKYCFERSNATEELIGEDDALEKHLAEAKKDDTLKKLLVPKTNFGPALVEHVLLESGFSPTAKISTFTELTAVVPQIKSALLLANDLMNSAGKPPKGFVIQKLVKRSLPDGSNEDFYSNEEFHPLRFTQHTAAHCKEFDSFNAAVDDFFSSMESQKLDLKVIQQERDALKKLENIRMDHDKRLANLQQVQETDERKARLIELNQPIIDHAIKVVRSALAAQMSWDDVEDLVDQATRKGDPVARTIKKLKLSTNQITLSLSDPYEGTDSDDEDKHQIGSLLVDIDLGLTAYANARKYFDEKKSASKKEQKTIESSMKAFKSAEKKTKQILKESAKIAVINKARKTHWFEKFYWFISSDNYLVVGGRDRQQNELLVKRYLKAGDIYVHADLQGASSVVVKNQGSSEVIPPRTLQEAGVMAVGYSAAWEARVMTTAWWVNSTQVSKTAPSGEYLTTGSFMIRGKKNFLPAVPIVLGFGLLFRLEDGSVFRHINDRKPKAIDDGPVVEDVEPAEEEICCSSDSETEVQQQEIEFPDTVVAQVPPIMELKRDSKGADDSEVYTIVGDVVQKKNTQPQTKNDPSKPQSAKPVNEQKSGENKQHPEGTGNQKRGQKGKMKKIKEKYKDQDEDERELKMKLLQSSGSAREKTKSKKKGGKQQETKSVSSAEKTTKPSCVRTDELAAERKPTEKEPGEQLQNPFAVTAVEEVDAAESDIINSSETDMLSAFTGVPLLEDEILYAMPVVAPYSTLAPYKFKVKVTTGQTKRGKAAKTALSVFLQDKAMTSRERDLIKSIKDQDLGRNLPGRVKLSIPQSAKKK